MSNVNALRKPVSEDSTCLAASFIQDKVREVRSRLRFVTVNDSISS